MNQFFECASPAYEILERVELSAADVEVPADGRHPEVVDTGAAQVGEHVRARLPNRRRTTQQFRCRVKKKIRRSGSPLNFV